MTEGSHIRVKTYLVPHFNVAIGLEANAPALEVPNLEPVGASLCLSNTSVGRDGRGSQSSTGGSLVPEAADSIVWL